MNLAIWENKIPYKIQKFSELVHYELFRLHGELFFKIYPDKLLHMDDCGYEEKAVKMASPNYYVGILI